MNKKLKNYTNQLLLVGSVGVLSGSFFIYIILTGKDDWDLYSLPLKILGVITAYIFAAHLAPGGSVTFNKRNKNQEEKKLASLIKKYKNNFIIALPAVIYILIDIFIGLSRYQANFNVTLEGLIYYYFFIFFVVVAMCEGAKYISAWVNIKRNWKKEFGNKR